jgi:hypothetical protein
VGNRQEAKAPRNISRQCTNPTTNSTTWPDRRLVVEIKAVSPVHPIHLGVLASWRFSDRAVLGHRSRLRRSLDRWTIRRFAASANADKKK